MVDGCFVPFLGSNSGFKGLQLIQHVAPWREASWGAPTSWWTAATPKAKNIGF